MATLLILANNFVLDKTEAERLIQMAPALSFEAGLKELLEEFPALNEASDLVAELKTAKLLERH